MEITKEDIQRGREAEGRNEKMNMMNKAHKTSTPASRAGYDGIRWGTPPPMTEWYAYRHINNSIHVKRYLEPFGAGDIDEAIESDFVIMVKGPYMAEGRADALLKARELL